MTMYRTGRRKLGDSWIEAEFGLQKIGEQAPYMSLTGVEFSHPTSRHDRYWRSCGQIRDRVLGAFPELATLAPWHLCTDGEPMHYMANARFWWEGHHCVRQRGSGETSEKIVAYFASTIAADALEGADWAAKLITMDWPHVKLALEYRLPTLQAKYSALVAKLPELAAATKATEI